MRILSLSRLNAHTEPLFKSYNILKLDDLYKQQELKFYYKFVHKKLPDFYLNFTLLRSSDQHNYNTRQNNNFITPRLRYNSSKSSILKRLPSIINETSENILEEIIIYF